MIQAALMSGMGIVELDENGFDVFVMHDPDTELVWVSVAQFVPGGPSTASIIRCDPGTMGRTLFSYRSTQQDGRHRLECVSWDGVVTSTNLPALPAVCAFVRAVRRDIEADQVPDLKSLAALHLGMAVVVPEVGPGTGPGYATIDFSQR